MFYKEQKGKNMALRSVQYTLNGVTYNLTYNGSTGRYEATITAPSKSSYTQDGHYYKGTVTATDTAGNIASVTQDTLAALKLVVREKAAPSIAIRTPTSGQLLANNKPTIEFDVTDTDSGVNPKHSYTAD